MLRLVLLAGCAELMALAAGCSDTGAADAGYQGQERGLDQGSRG